MSTWRFCAQYACIFTCAGIVLQFSACGGDEQNTEASALSSSTANTQSQTTDQSGVQEKSSDAVTTQVAASDEIVDSTAQTTRTIPAYLPTDSNERTIRTFEVTFTAQPNERRLISGLVNAYQKSSTPDELLMASVSVSCEPQSAPAYSVGSVQNTLRGKTTVLTPRFVYAYPNSTAGTVTCRLGASGARPRPVSSGQETDNVWQVENGSSLTASAPIGSKSQTFISTDTSRVLNADEYWRTFDQQAFEVDAGTTTFRILSDHKVTTCSSVGGSSDATAEELCRGRTSTQGTTMHHMLRVRQKKEDGSWCTDSTVIYDKPTPLITKDIHHYMIFSEGEPVNVESTCGSNKFTVTSTLINESGADVMVHAPSERTMIVVPAAQ
jgi:hypothetical protein